MRTLLLLIIGILALSGCSSVRSIQVPTQETRGEWVSDARQNATETSIATTDTKTKTRKQKGRMHVRKKESKYVIKDEPYSIASKKKDPELLGPQRTYNADEAQTKVRKRVRRKRGSGKMTKESCISLIGEARYNKYVQKYGGEAGALRRCLVLKRLRG